MKLERGKAVINEPFWKHPDNGEEIIMDKRYVDLNEILLALPKSAAKIIEDWPAADVREVVLCRDCKWYGGREWDNNETGICARTDFGVSYDSFCSAAKRREEQT